MNKYMAINNQDEIQKVRDRYARRQNDSKTSLYAFLNPTVYMSQQEKELALIRWIKKCHIAPLENKRVLEIGCGSGENLLQFIRLGFQPAHLVGNELLEERAKKARHLLPVATQILVGDASTLEFEDGSFDIVLQSTVFTSILDEQFQQKLANRMWSMVKVGGGVLWYDFTMNNPSNPDVKGVPVYQIRQLFPEGNIQVWSLTLAPPISRRVTKLHPSLYSLFNRLTFLRTHVLCWIKKTED